MARKMLNKKFNRKTRIAVIEIDTTGSSANILNEQFFDELRDLLDLAEVDNAINGIVFTTKKKKVFLAGADLVQIGTYNYTNPNAGVDILSELIEYCNNNNVSNLSNLKGKVEYHD